MRFKREFNNLEKVVKLASNENPLSVPPHVAEAVNREISQLGRYPDPASYYLTNRLAERNGISPANIIVGAGSVELIRIAHSFFP